MITLISSQKSPTPNISAASVATAYYIGLKRKIASYTSAQGTMHSGVKTILKSVSPL